MRLEHVLPDGAHGRGQAREVADERLKAQLLVLVGERLGGRLLGVAVLPDQLKLLLGQLAAEERRDEDIQQANATMDLSGPKTK